MVKRHCLLALVLCDIADPVFAANDERLKPVSIGVSAQNVELKADPTALIAGNARIIEHLA
jgi:hypothetical protein